MKDLIYINCDGGSRGNPGPAGIGVVIWDANHKKLEEVGEKIGNTTNNVAEYKSLIKALKLASTHTNKTVNVFMDSELIIRQVTGVYKVKAPHLKPLVKEVQDLEKNFQKVNFKQITRNDIYQTQADRMVNMALDNIPITPIKPKKGITTTLYIATTIDGFIADKKGSVKWLDKFNNSGEDYGYDDFLKSIDTVILGNTTYKQFKAPYPGKEVFVFANKEGKEENITYVNKDVKEFIKSLGNKPRNIWLVGGANLLNQFLKYNLIDEFRIFVMPTILGSGIRLFTEDNKEASLKLTRTKTYESGVVEINYVK